MPPARCHDAVFQRRAAYIFMMALLRYAMPDAIFAADCYDVDAAALMLRRCLPPCLMLCHF